MTAAPEVEEVAATPTGDLLAACTRRLAGQPLALSHAASGPVGIGPYRSDDPAATIRVLAWPADDARLVVTAHRPGRRGPYRFALTAVYLITYPNGRTRGTFYGRPLTALGSGRPLTALGSWHRRGGLTDAHADEVLTLEPSAGLLPQ